MVESLEAQGVGFLGRGPAQRRTERAPPRAVADLLGDYSAQVHLVRRRWRFLRLPGAFKFLWHYRSCRGMRMSDPGDESEPQGIGESGRAFLRDRDGRVAACQSLLDSHAPWDRL